jgi:predicted nucleic acid-binding protein
MNRVIADASFCGAWVLEDESSADAEALLQAVESGQATLLVPSLWKYEMLNLLRSACRRGRLEAGDANAAQLALSRVPLEQVDVPDAIAEAEILRLAQAHNLSAYDASYLELAIRFRAPLRTADSALKRAARECGIPEPV